MTYIGRPIRRLEDPPLLTGKAQFAADLVFPGEVSMRVVRSQVASGRILGVELEQALQLPGVVAVWTADDLDLPPIGFRMTDVGGLESYRQPVLASDYVRYVGEPMAVVFAENAYLAEDAADLVWVEIEELEPALDATLPGTFLPGMSADAAIIEKAYGDVEAAMASSEHLIELELTVGRHTGVPLETRGAIGVWDGNILRLYGAAKVPHYNRDAIAQMLGLSPEMVQLHENHVGGGFGIRGELYPEDVLVCAAARILERPVRWIEDRREHLTAANHSRDQVHRIKVGFDDRGFVVAIDDEFWQDQGAYVRTHAATVTDLTAAMLPGPYLVPAYRARGHMVLTNKTPAGTYRSPGRYEGTFVRERAIDAVASRLGLDPFEVRRVNLIPEERIPFERGIDALGTEVIYDSGRYHDLLERVLQHLDYPTLRRDLERRRAAGEMVGFGLAYFVEKSGLGPFDEVRVEVDTDGRVEVITGAASLGQGVETSIAQICAEELGVAIESVRVTHGQTERIGRGMGAFATRVTVMTGSATTMAAGSVREKALRVAADLLEANAADLRIEDGRVFVEGSRNGPSLTLADLALAVAPGSDGAGRHGAGLVATEEFLADHMTYPYGIHAAVVVVDPATAGCRVIRYLVGYDVGRAVNPMLVEGQLVGGVAQGIGGALLEEFRYDDAGQPLSASFMDYLLPTASEIPAVELVLREDAPSPLNPLGVKGAGEGGINATGAVIAAAVDDALGLPMAVLRLPISPERLHQLLSG
ncbi:MAG TPA: xanthine dehydrogenase family protein molybdopterin-binding subunit [Acidimicrobiia bacterium]|nr:xanthine dehydrogenase family protein molybdopterin-binding subunit [Acidimicrobiia bacterium]